MYLQSLDERRAWAYHAMLDRSLRVCAHYRRQIAMHFNTFGAAGSLHPTIVRSSF